MFAESRSAGLHGTPPGDLGVSRESVAQLFFHHRVEDSAKLLDIVRVHGAEELGVQVGAILGALA